LRDVYIIGVGMTKFAKHLDRNIKSLTHEAVRAAVADAGIATDAIEAAWFSNSSWGYFSGQHSIRGEVALREMGIQRIPITNVENACASASTALNNAILSLMAGACECVLAVGAEKMYHEDRARMFGAFFMGLDVERQEEQMALFAGLGKDLPVPGDAMAMGGKAGQDKSVFMDVYGGMARFHMGKYGTTQRQLAAISAKNHFHSSMNPYAQYQKDMTVEEVLAGRMVSYPLTVPMCAPVGDGAAAAIACSGSFLTKLKNVRPVRVRASVLGSGSNRSPEEETQDITFRLSAKAYEMAGLGPEDADVAEVHDATAFGELHLYEALRFCALGQGGPFAESGATRLGGKLPVNTSGGLESRGHPIGASGLGQIHELVTQLRGDAGQRQVAGARIALAENGGGVIGIEEAAEAIHILEKV
jgi:acetyl-CoA acyltransferase